MNVTVPRIVNNREKGGREAPSLSTARILFFVPEGDLATNGVYASQVGGLAKYCERLGATCNIWGNRFHGHHWFFQVVGYARKLIDDNSEDLLDFKPTHIYVRNAAVAIAAKKLARMSGAKLVYSVRGADVAEALMTIGFRSLLIAANRALQVRRAIRLADHVNAVSKTMSDWLYDKYRRKSSILPCCVAESSFVNENSISEHEHKTIVYSGGLSKWQKIDSIIVLMKKMSELDADIRFLFLTKDIDQLECKCAQHGFPKDRWRAKSCRPSDVVGELAKADCGIILRDDTIVNRVASPIKVGEYLAAGLGVIASPNIGDVGKDLANQDFACLVDNMMSVGNIVGFVKGLSMSKRSSSLHWAKEHLTYSGNRSAVMEMFG